MDNETYQALAAVISRHLRSFAETFVAVFISTLLIPVQQGHPLDEATATAALMAAAAAGLRAGVKALRESLEGIQTTNQQQ